MAKEQEHISGFQHDMFTDKEQMDVIPFADSDYKNMLGNCNLEDIDLITASYPSREAFLADFYGTYTVSPKYRLVIAYKNKDIQFKPIIFNNPLIAQCAAYVKEEKAKGKLAKDIEMEETLEVKEYLTRVRKYLRFDTINSILEELKTRISPLDYKLITEYCYGSKPGQYTKELNQTLLKYSVIRPIVVWEEKSKDEYRLIGELKDKEALYHSLMDEENYARRPIESSTIQSIYENMRKPNGSIDYERLFNEVDIDDLYNSGNVEDLKSSGILPSNGSKDRHIKR